jgi:hypothetical protein
VGEWARSNGWRMWPARRGRPRYMAALALTRLDAWLAGQRRQPLQRAEDDAWGEDDARNTRRWRRRPPTLADRSGPHDPRERARIFSAVSRQFVSSGVPERVPEGRGWPGLAGWMKAQIRAKSRNRGRDWAVFHRPDEKIRVPRALSGSWVEML